MAKSRQALYALRDFFYTLVLAIFGWVLADFQGFMNHPIAATGTFFENSWNLTFTALLIIAYGVEVVFCPGLVRPRDEVRNPWRRWKGMLMEANLVPATFCARLGVMQMAHSDYIRYAGLFFFAISLAVTVSYGRVRSEQIKKVGDNSFATTGIYRKVRFPEYLAQLTYSLGVALLFKSWLALIATILLLRYMVVYVRKLNGYVQEKYMRDWSEYSRKTRLLIPFIY